MYNIIPCKCSVFFNNILAKMTKLNGPKKIVYKFICLLWYICLNKLIHRKPCPLQSVLIRPESFFEFYDLSSL